MSIMTNLHPVAGRQMVWRSPGNWPPMSVRFHHVYMVDGLPWNYSTWMLFTLALTKSQSIIPLLFHESSAEAEDVWSTVEADSKKQQRFQMVQ